MCIFSGFSLLLSLLIYCSEAALGSGQTVVFIVGSNTDFENVFADSSVQCKIVTAPGIKFPRTPCQVFDLDKESLPNILKGSYGVIVDTSGSLPLEETKAVVEALASAEGIQHVVWSFLPPRVSGEGEKQESIDHIIAAEPTVNAITTRVFTTIFYHQFLKNNFVTLTPNKTKWAVALPFEDDTAIPLLHSGDLMKVTFSIINNHSELKGSSIYLSSAILTPKQIAKAFEVQRMGIPVASKKASEEEFISKFPSVFKNFALELSAVPTSSYKIFDSSTFSITPTAFDTYLAQHKDNLRTYIRKHMMSTPRVQQETVGQDNYDMVCKNSDETNK